MSSPHSEHSPPTSSRSPSPELGTGSKPSSPTHESEDAVKRHLLEAGERKQEGTEHFRGGRYAEALVSYRGAIGLLPRRPIPPAEDKGKGKGKGKGRLVDPPEDPETDSNIETAEPSEEKDEHAADSELVEHAVVSPLEEECAKTRAVLNANIGACHVKLEEWQDAVKACTEAIADDPTYVKVILRRAQANEKIGSWSALSSAQEDYNTLLELYPKGSAQARDAERALRLLKPRAEAAQKREVDEMMGKLKGVGNTILGKFGLSTDNFKFEPNGQGGYSMNFVR